MFHVQFKFPTLDNTYQNLIYIIQVINTQICAKITSKTKLQTKQAQ